MLQIKKISKHIHESLFITLFIIPQILINKGIKMKPRNVYIK